MTHQALPSLPRDAICRDDTRHDTPYYTAQHMSEYGQACYAAALASKPDAAPAGGAVQALRELVALKDLKERVEAMERGGFKGTVGGADGFTMEPRWHEAKALLEEYNRRKPSAWAAARAALAAAPVVPPDSSMQTDPVGASPCGGPGSTLQPPAAASAAIPGANTHRWDAAIRYRLIELGWTPPAT